MTYVPSHHSARARGQADTSVDVKFGAIFGSDMCLLYRHQVELPRPVGRRGAPALGVARLIWRSHWRSVGHHLIEFTRERLRVRAERLVSTRSGRQQQSVPALEAPRASRRIKSGKAAFQSDVRDAEPCLVWCLPPYGCARALTLALAAA